MFWGRPVRHRPQAIAAYLFISSFCLGQTQHQAQVCDTFDGSDCHLIDTSTIGGLRIEDYKITNPAAVQFDPALRLKELSALGPSTAQTLCSANPQATYILSAPTITFSGAAAQIREVSYQSGNTTVVQEFLDVEFDNFTASNGYSSPAFGFKMTRNRGVQDYYIAFHPGNPGLQNVPLNNEVNYHFDPVRQTAAFGGSLPSSPLLAGALFGVFLNVQSILQAAAYTAEPAASGQPLWTQADLIALAGQAASMILATTNPVVAVAPDTSCFYNANGYPSCVGTDNMVNLENLALQWGGEYLGLRTQLSASSLRRNFLAWANANAPIIDPNLPPSARGDSYLAIFYEAMGMVKPILMLWPTLRTDPAFSPADSQLIENWITTKLMPIAAIPGGVNGGYPFTNNWGYYGVSVQMADAIRRSDHLTFAKAIQEFYVALNQMSADGSFPLEAARSACSVTYTNVDITHLTSIAEMAATQGYDLYSLNVNGKTLETAIEFLLNARDNPALINQYSKAGGGVCFEGNPGDPADFSEVFNSVVPSDLAWTESYIARFPFSATAARLRKIVGTDITQQPFPLWFVYTGLNASCAFRKRYEFSPVNGVKVSTVSGNGQTVAPNQPSAAPLSVKVTDSAGNPVAGALVSFAVVQGSASVVAPAQTLTDATGLAAATVRMGMGTAPVTVTATALGTPVSFSILPAPLPTSVSITGSGGSQTFTFTFSDPGGYENLQVVDVLINNALDGRRACFVAFVPSSNSLLLVDDAGDAGGPYQGLVLPGSGSIGNGQCTINGAGSSVIGSGTTLTLTLAITFSAGFAGNKIVYLSAQDKSAANSGWQALSTWSVPGSTPAGPAVSGMSPARTYSLGPATYTFTFSDTNGWKDISVANVLANSAIDGRHACYLAFVPASATSGSVFLVDDGGDAAGPYSGMVVPGSGTVSNSQCSISAAGSSVAGSGNTLTLMLPITFSPGFAANQVFYLAARSNTLNSGWQAVGSVSVP